MPRDRNAEPVKLIATRPDGSKLLGQWQYEHNPTEGWVWNTWVEGGPEDEDDAAEERIAADKQTR